MVVKKEKYKALVVEETGPGVFERKIRDRVIGDLPPGEVLIRVKYSSLNYKDALSASGNKAVTKNYPHTPGIDAAGIIEKSETDKFRAGDQAIVHGYDLGMNTSGGFGQYIRVPASWVVELPEGIELKESMIYGTAGFTAAMSVAKLVESVRPEDGEILVTGATGGVGCVAVAILSKLGYTVVAGSGKSNAKDFLQKLGAKEVIGREELKQDLHRPLAKARWAGVVDTVGGELLAAAIKATKPHGVVTCCGNVASPDLPLNVYPFILRGVTLVGIDAQNCRMAVRKQIWKKLATDWKISALDKLYKEVSLHELSFEIDQMLKALHLGRILVDLGSLPK
ncbi:MAG: YhdH/YhfP family quinone oxidoreductase [Opitutaceae bacterium]|nr:YhdH/YhfP family quinone oxidoreductase [Opitutaceae bacterium]